MWLHTQQQHLGSLFISLLHKFSRKQSIVLATTVMEDFKPVQLTSQDKGIPKNTSAEAKEDHKSLKVGKQCIVILVAVIATIAVLVIVAMLILIILTFNTNATLVRNIDELEHRVKKSSEELNTLKLLVNQSVNEVQIEFNDLEQRLLTKIDYLEERTFMCEELSPPDNGEISVAPGPNSLSHGLGSVATYSCDPGYALVGQTTRTCEDTNGGTVTTGTWSGTPPHCQVIMCSELTAPDNGTIEYNTTSQLLGVGTTATYSCDPGYVLVGETTRTCEDTNTAANGTWSGVDPTCAIPNRAVTDCFGTRCRYEQLVCPVDKNCTVHCYDSRPYACIQAGVECPEERGDCTVNCDDSYACLQANATCSQGDCTVNCENDYTCLHSAMECSGDNCLLNCEGQESCSHSTVECLGGNCQISCLHDSTCQHLDIECTAANCVLDCRDTFSCQASTVICSSTEDCSVHCRAKSYACQKSLFTCPEGGNCEFEFNGQSDGNNIGNSAIIFCQENSACEIYCAGLSSSAHRQCYNSRITCPTENGECTIECSGYYSCQFSTITSGPEEDSLMCSGEYSCTSASITCLNEGNCLSCSGPHSCNSANIAFQSNNSVANLSCTGRHSCRSAKIICPANNTCTINCDGQNSCQNARVTCPTGDYSCNILCTDPLSCSNLSITNTHNVYLQCCGGEKRCAGTSVIPDSTECPYIE